MRLTALASLLACSMVLLATASAPLGQAQLPGAQARSQPAASPSLAIPQDFVGQGPLHRVLLRRGDPALTLLEGVRAVVALEDYESFALLVIDAQRLGGLAGITSLGLELADEQTLINLNGYLLDGADAAGTASRLAEIPAALRASPPGALVAQPGADEQHLRLVQFAGPIKQAWLDSLLQSGAQLVSYVPNNAYVLRVDAQADAALLQLVDKPYVLSLSSYEPAYKLRPELRPPSLLSSERYKLIVQVVAHEQGAAFAQALARRSLAPVVEPNAVLGYLNVEVELDGASLLALAADSRVFAIEPKLEARLFDERQGQIMAGNLNAAGTQPSGTGYLAWLQSLGFPGVDPFPFAVDVTDDGLDRGSLGDVNVEFRVGGTAAGASRFVFTNNYTNDALGDSRAGHGNLNASIIAGFNGLSGTAYEDSAFYNYGLGVAPWVKLGNSKVFSNAGAGVFSQPANVRLANAYNGGARISSNSWGFTSGTTYNTDSQLHDQLVRDALSATSGNQELTVVFAAGNSGPGASSVHPPGTAKNILTVGACENWRMTGSDGCAVTNTGADSALDIIDFSSRGPTSDARKKPEILAPGTHIEGAASRATGYDGSGVCNQYWPTGQTLYAWSSGTSHSTPAIAGACALLRQWFANNALGTPSPALLKAWLVASTNYMTGLYANDTLWSNNQGFGRVNLGRSFDGVSRTFVDQTQLLGASGATYTTSGTIPNATQPFRVALAWTDAPGPTTGNAWVNNLDLEVTLNGTLYRGNVFSGANSISGGVADARNNLECVFLPAGTSGSFSVTVRATNIAGDGVPGNADTTDQDFALLVYNGSSAAPAPDFSLAASPTSATITAGGSANFALSSTALNGFSGNLSLSASPAISGLSYTFSANPVAVGAASTWTCSTTTALAAGTYTLTITAGSGALTHSSSVNLTVNAAPLPDFSLGLSPSSGTVTAGGSASFTLLSGALNGFTGSISLSATPALSGLSYSFSVNPVTAGGSSLLTCNTSSALSTGLKTITITGTSGALTHSTTLALTVNAAGGTGNPVKSYTLAPALPVPDNSTVGVTSTLNVADSLTIGSIAVTTVITHPYKGDLVVTLIGPDGTSAILHERSGGSADNVNTTFAIATVPAQALAIFQGKSSTGAWKLKVQDLAASDVGTLNSWALTFQGEKSLTPNAPIPDNSAAGVSSTLVYGESGTVAAVRVKVGLTHTYQGDLKLSLIAPDGTTVVLHNLSGGTTDNLNTEYPDLSVPNQSLSAFNGKSITGNWRLLVQDLAAQDTGTLNSWTLSLTAQ